MVTKRDWITRMIDLMHNLKKNIIYNATNVRDFLKDNFDDSISLPTTIALLNSIVKAQKNGMVFIVDDKIRKLKEKKTVNDDSRYELIESDDDLQEFIQ